MLSSEVLLLKCCLTLVPLESHLYCSFIVLLYCFLVLSIVLSNDKTKLSKIAALMIGWVTAGRNLVGRIGDRPRFPGVAGSNLTGG